MEIRLLTAADYPSAYQLWSSTPGMGLRELDDSREGFERFLRRNPFTCFAAAETGGLIGTILCGHDGRRGYIYHTAVQTGVRRKGVGRALVTAALTALRREGIHKAGVVVFRQNPLGNDFCRPWGSLCATISITAANPCDAASPMRTGPAFCRGSGVSCIYLTRIGFFG